MDFIKKLGPFYKKNSDVTSLVTGDDQQVRCVLSNDTQGITVFISNYRVFLHGKSHIC